MLATGDFVAPHLNGYRYYEKPPLHYWAVAASMSLFGEEEWAARLPVKLSAAGMVLLTVLFARRRFGERVALLAGLIVATSFLVSRSLASTSSTPLSRWPSRRPPSPSPRSRSTSDRGIADALGPRSISSTSPARRP